MQTSHLQTWTQQSPIGLHRGIQCQPLALPSELPGLNTSQPEWSLPVPGLVPHKTLSQEHGRAVAGECSSCGISSSPQTGAGQHLFGTEWAHRTSVCQGCPGSPLAAWAVRGLCAIQGEALQGQQEHWHKVSQCTAPSTETSAHRSCTVVEGRGELLQLPPPLGPSISPSWGTQSSLKSLFDEGNF